LFFAFFRLRPKPGGKKKEKQSNNFYRTISLNGQYKPLFLLICQFFNLAFIHYTNIIQTGAAIYFSSKAGIIELLHLQAGLFIITVLPIT